MGSQLARNRFPDFTRRSVSSLVIALALVGCEKDLTPEQRQQRAADAVGLDASIAATFFVSAVRACQVVGLSRVDQCAQLKGSLVAEQSAQMTAKLSVEQTAKFWKSCQAAFTDDYCSRLIQRAVAIEYRKPRTVGE